MTNEIIGKRRILIGLLALAICPYFIGLSASSLWDSNESFYAETPRRMLETGDWLSPSFNYQPRFNKPPLSYWIVALHYRVFGVSEAVERIPIVLGAMVMIAVAFFLGRVLHSVEAGLISAIVLAISPRFLMFSRRIAIDVFLSAFMGLTLLFFVLAEVRPERRRLFLTLMYVSAGLATLTKGPVALLLPTIIFLVYLTVTRNLDQIRRSMLFTGILIVGVIVIPWYVAVYFEHGGNYISSFLLEDNFSRFTEPVWGPSRGPFFYIGVILGDLLPLSLFLLPAIWWVISSARGKSRPRTTILLTWILVIIVFFSLSRSKEDLYILPVFPAAAALIGIYLSRLLSSEEVTQRSTHQSIARVVWFIPPLLLLASGVGLTVLSLRPVELATVNGLKAAGLILSFSGLLAIGLLFGRRRLSAVVSTVAGLIVLNWVFVIAILPDVERFKPVKQFSEVIQDQASPDSVVGYYRFASPSMVFYLKRPIVEYYETDQVKTAFESGRDVYFIMLESDYLNLRDSLNASSHILARGPVLQVKLNRIFQNTPVPQVLLVSNRKVPGISE